MILAVIQARMGSSRLPGKVLKDVFGVKILELVYSRLQKSKLIDDIILAIPDIQSDDVLAQFLSEKKINFFRGASNDVLSRIVGASNVYNCSHIVRITGDCPLICPEIIDKMIELSISKKVDYAWVHESFAEGADGEIIKANVLKEADEKAILTSEREHVTQYIHNNSNRFSRQPLINDFDDSNFRFVLDNPEDFEVLKKILNYFPREEWDTIKYNEIINYFRANPEIANLNKHIIRNEGLSISLKNDKKIR